MEHIKDILPSAIQQLTKNKVEYYKRQANHYAKLYIKNGNFASEYKRDYFNNLFTADEAVIIVNLRMCILLMLKNSLTSKRVKDGNKRYCNDLRRYIKIMSNAKYSEIIGIYYDL